MNFSLETTSNMKACLKVIFSTIKIPCTMNWGLDSFVGLLQGFIQLWKITIYVKKWKVSGIPNNVMLSKKSIMRCNLMRSFWSSSRKWSWETVQGKATISFTKLTFNYWPEEKTKTSRWVKQQMGRHAIFVWFWAILLM